MTPLYSMMNTYRPGQAPLGVGMGAPLNLYQPGQAPLGVGAQPYGAPRSTDVGAEYAYPQESYGPLGPGTRPPPPQQELYGPLGPGTRPPPPQTEVTPIVATPLEDRVRDFWRGYGMTPGEYYGPVGGGYVPGYGYWNYPQPGESWLSYQMRANQPYGRGMYSQPAMRRGSWTFYSTR